MEKNINIRQMKADDRDEVIAMMRVFYDSPAYAMVSLGYTTEYGGVCVWLEDLYIKPEYRRFGIATELLAYIEREFPDAVRFKLEVEQENEPAYACYFRGGYRMSDYGLMTKENV